MAATYATPTQVRDVLSRDASPEGTAAELGDTRITEAIESAEAEVNVRLATRYTVPFDSNAVPDVVGDLTRDIAAYLASLTYRQNKDFSSEQDPVLRRYQRALDLLKALATGDADLGGGGGDDAPTATAGASGRNQYRGRLFSGEHSLEWLAPSTYPRTRRAYREGDRFRG